jgi:SGNH domain (fused to AT3 domains)
VWTQARLAAERKIQADGLGNFFHLTYAVFAYSKATPFPGLYALVPTLGTVLVILFATQQTIVGKFVGNRAFVGVGLISYSAYLWHQPLFAFARHRSLFEPTNNVFILLSMLALLLAYVSWKFVEAPFRKNIIFGQVLIFNLTILGSIIFLSIGVFGYANNGYPNRISGNFELGKLDLVGRPSVGLDTECASDKFTLSSKCSIGLYPEFVIWGDSFAMHLIPAFVENESTVGFRQHTMSSCAPVLGLAQISLKRNSEWVKECISFNDSVIEWVEKNPKIKYVILSSPFGWLSSSLYLKDGSILKAGNHTNFVADRLEETVSRIRASGKRVVLVSPTPNNNGKNIGQCAVKSLLFENNSTQCDFVLSNVPDENLEFKLMNEVIKFVPVIRLDSMICPAGVCDTVVDGVVIYRDSGHLSHEGSKYLESKYQLISMIRKVAE